MTKEKRSSAEEKERHIYHQKLKQLEQLRWKEIEELDAEDISSGLIDAKEQTKR